MPAGRPPDSTNELKFRGTFRGDRHAGRAVAEACAPPLVKLPKAPKAMGLAGRKQWRAIGAELIMRSILTAGDLGLLEELCAEFDTLADADEELGSHKLLHPRHPLTEDAAYGRKEHPALGTRRKCKAAILVMRRELGLTPVSRRRVPPATSTAPAQKVADPWGLASGEK